MHSTATLLLFLLLAASAAGQAPKPDSSFIQTARYQAVATYENATRVQSHVFEGNEYIAHDHRIKIHPFYRVDSLQTGTVAFNGVTYHNVQMLYDIVRDELAVQPPEGGFRIRLRNDKITTFSMGPYRFIRLEGNSTVGAPTGFYEVLHNGRLRAVARRIKTIHEDISSGSYKADFLQEDHFFILKEGVYYPVKTKRSLLNLFPDQAKTLRKFIRANTLKFTDEQREEAITRVTQQYEELSK